MWKKRNIALKDSLLKLRSKELLVFLFFLFVSAVFWLTSTLNETYETEIKVPLRLEGIPEKVVITDELPDTIRITLRDKGFTLLQYSLEQTRTITLLFDRYAKKNGVGNVPTSDLQRIMRQKLYESTTIVNVKADHLDFYYIYGEVRRLPIVLNGQVKAAADRYVTEIILSPDSIDVYATADAFDSIHAVYTEPVMIEQLTASVTKEVPLQHIYGTKTKEAATTTINATVDLLTEVVVSVPIKTVNTPEKTLIKTFPANVDVRVSVCMANVKQIRPELFSVVADYNDLPKSGEQSHLPIKLVTQPKATVKAYLKNTEVDYIIEHLKEN